MITQKEILQILPHRYPFLLVDRILEIEPQKRAVGIKNVTFNEPFFQGHFPGNPIMPGVLILEAMAQVCAIAVKYQNEAADKLGVFTGIDNCKMRKMVRPGDTLRIEVEITKLRRNIGKAQTKAYVGEDVACQADLTFAMVDEED
jgi:3-hydroxyacyl-[acyl-carrier-protein] dehydratase